VLPYLIVRLLIIYPSHSFEVSSDTPLNRKVLIIYPSHSFEVLGA